MLCSYTIGKLLLCLRRPCTSNRKTAPISHIIPIEYPDHPSTELPDRQYTPSHHPISQIFGYQSVMAPTRRSKTQSHQDASSAGSAIPTSRDREPLIPQKQPPADLKDEKSELWQNDTARTQWPHCPTPALPMVWRRWWRRPCSEGDMPEQRYGKECLKADRVRWFLFPYPVPYESKAAFIARQAEIGGGTERGEEALGGIWEEFQEFYPPWRSIPNQWLDVWARDNNRRWTEDEDDKLCKLCEEDKLTWEEVAETLGRKVRPCKYRYRSLMKGKVTYRPQMFGTWTEEQDSILLERYAKYGTNWTGVAEAIEGHSNEHCRLRYRFLRYEKARKGVDREVERDFPYGSDEELSDSTAEPTMSAKTSVRRSITSSNDPNSSDWFEDTSGLQDNLNEYLFETGHLQEGAEQRCGTFDDVPPTATYSENQNDCGYPGHQEFNRPLVEMFGHPLVDSSETSESQSQDNRKMRLSLKNSAPPPTGSPRNEASSSAGRSANARKKKKSAGGRRYW